MCDDMQDLCRSPVGQMGLDHYVHTWATQVWSWVTIYSLIIYMNADNAKQVKGKNLSSAQKTDLKNQ